MSSPIPVSQLNVNDVSFNFFKSPDNKKRVYINKNKNCKESISFQLCETNRSKMLRAPFGVSEPMQGAADSSRLSIEVAVDCPEIANKLKELNDRCIQYAHAESVKCFGKQLELSTIRDRFVSPYREVDVEGRSNLLRLKISDSTDVYNMSSFDDSGMKLKRSNKSCIQRGSTMVPSVDLSSLWFVSGDKQFGYSLHMKSVIVNNEFATGGNRPQNTGVQSFIVEDGFTITVDEPSPSKKRSAEEAGLEIDGILEDASIDPQAYL